MSSIKTTQIDGDVSVGRNVAIGGKARVAGSATIGHNLKVEGWLEAPNIKDINNKGLFASSSALEAAYPTPRVGWWAMVGDSSPFAIYRCNSAGTWTATGGTASVSLTIDAETIAGWVSISSTSELPEDPTDDERGKGYLLGTVLYVYVGTGGDTLDGLYQSAQLKGETGTTVNIGEADIADNLTTDDATKVLSAKQGKVLKGLIDNIEIPVVNDLETGGEGNALSAEMGKVLRDMLDEAKEPFEQEYVLCGDIGYYNYGDKYFACNADDVFETDVYIEKIRFNKDILDSISSTREAKTIRYAIVDSSYKVTSIHSSTLASDGYEISVGLVLPAGSRLAFVSETLGTDASNRTVRNIGYKNNQGTGANHYTYVNQYQVGKTLSLSGTDKLTGFEVIAKKYDPTIVNSASDVPYTDNVGQGYNDVQEVVEALQDANNVYNALFYSQNDIISDYYDSGYYRVTDRHVSAKAEKIYRIEFDERLLSKVVDRADVTVTWIVADTSYVIRQLGRAVLKSTASHIDVAIDVPAGHHIGLKDFIAGQDSEQNDVHGFCVTNSGKTETTGHFAYSNGGIGSGMVVEKKEIYNVRYCTISSLKEDVEKHSVEIDELKTIVGENSVGVGDATTCLMLGSSLTDDAKCPKGLGWCDRLNDLVDVNILNGGWSGSALLSNIQKTVLGHVNHDFTTASNYRKIPYKVDYLWWGNSANYTPVGAEGTQQLKEAKKATEMLGAKMLIGTEHAGVTNISGEQYDSNRRVFGSRNNVPISAVAALAGKLRAVTTNPSGDPTKPYNGFSDSGTHNGYRANSFFFMHYDLLSRLAIWKNVKLFKVRPDYQEGSPTIAELVYENNEERFKFFTAIAAGCGGYFSTGLADNVDNSNYGVTSEPAPTLVQEEFELLKGNAVTFNKFCLAEFILDRIRITKATFSAQVSVEPTAIYIATKKTAYSNGCTEWVEITDKSYANGVLTANIENETREIEAFDKVRILLYYSSGEFTLNKPTLYDYDGIKKEPYDLLNGYHNRLYGEELNDKTSVESGWTLNGTSEVKALPTEIANYSDYNTVKQHIELMADTDTVSKTINLSTPVSKVAIRIVANLFPKIATSRTFTNMTAAQLEEYISSTPTVVESGYNFGTLTLDVNGGVFENFLMHPGWQEFYTEVEMSNTDASITLTIGRANAVDGFDTNEDFKVLIHDVSVQKIG